MKNYIKYFGILALGMVACEPEFENPVDDQDAYTSGEADFSNYVALGNSLTAGYADGTLYLSGQQNSYPNILAQQFAKVQETNGFTQPLVADNSGGLLLNGTQLPGYNTRLVLGVSESGPAPRNYGGAITTDVSNILTGPFNNMAVPGAKSYELLAPGYGSMEALMQQRANPYFVRFASAPNTTVVADAIAQDPTFFTLWIGNNDVFLYAVSGGVGVDQTGNLDPSEYGRNDISDPQVFAGAYSQIVSEMVEAGAEEGVLLNIPDVTSAAFFNTVPNNALVLNAEQAAGLTGYFQAVAGIFTQYLMSQQVPAAQAQAIASQYAITFNEGPNRFLIEVPVTQTNPLGFRQMTQEELLLLTINQAALKQQGYGTAAITPQVMEVLGILQAGGQPTQEQAQLVLNAVNAIDDKDALDQSEIQAIDAATAAYNQTINQVAQANDLALVDMNALSIKVSNEGIPYDAGTLTGEFAVGGLFSLDGVHFTPRGYALVANEVIKAINSTYNATVPKVNIGNYKTITPSND
ncbi:GDSL-like Lipase/Acylhydrolase [Salinimicrobium sediminis]|uniref:GDSL-like Lipase/Acylhydrolase n=1 Tax=Salinimicrobium sediminis TaxID=1343891 RepID=A0A285X0R1_9FLAO|nr:G-D-S-L family lipolytic protein [Salinimicrobium sediminis]SOC78915.1 GDSL-like Lipase/Acylhydrolase [Salinimicrobium sediminis]